MVTRVYRREPVLVHASGGQVPLGYLDFNRASRCAFRYTPEGAPIDTNGPWSTDFDTWTRTYDDLWTLDPRQAYFCADPDMTMDEGL